MSISRRVIYAVFDDCAGCKHRELIDELRKMTVRIKKKTGVMLVLMVVQPGNSRYWTLRKAHKFSNAPFFVFDGVCYRHIDALEVQCLAYCGQ